AFSVLGETTPATFDDAITNESMGDGFLSRWVTIQYTGDRPQRNWHPIYPDPRFMGWLHALIGHALKMQVKHPYTPVMYGPGTADRFGFFSEKADKEIDKAGDDESRRHLWNRAHLNALRVASLLAVADNHMNPTMAMA